MLDPLHKSIFPIIYYDDNKRAELAGTSIYVQHNNSHFLVTASHVLKDIGSKYQLYVLIPGKAIRLPGPAFMSKEPSTVDSLELDIAFFPLSIHPEILSYLEGYSLFDLVDYDGQTQYAREHYIMFGYPYRKARHVIEDNEFKTKDLYYNTDKVECEEIYAKYKRPKSHHIIVDYFPKNTKNQNGIEVTAPHPHGISGGALFRALIDENDMLQVLILEGILTEWKDKKYAVATKINALRDFIGDYR